jgi:hypothetical protein
MLHSDANRTDESLRPFGASKHSDNTLRQETKREQSMCYLNCVDLLPTGARAAS